MPYIEFKSNIVFTKAQEETIKSEAARLLESSFPGKTEKWLMVNLESACSMYFAGSDKPCMLIDVAIFGAQSGESYDKMTAGLCELIEKVCKVEADRVYVKYSEVEHWGWNGVNF